MPKRNFPYMLVFLTCLLAGFLGGNIVFKPGRAAGKTSAQPVITTALEAAPTSAPVEAIDWLKPAPLAAPTQSVGPDSAEGIGNGQRSVLLIAVDDLEAKAPRLESIWLVAYVPASPGAYFVPIFPASLSGGASPDKFLENNFAIDPLGFLSQPFTAFLHGREIYWTNYLIIDETGMKRAIDMLGGLAGDGRTQTGKQALDALPRPWDNPALALRTQGNLLRSICEQAGSDTAISLTQGLHNLIGYIRTDIHANQLNSDLQALRDAGGQLCKFPSQTRQATKPAGH